MVENNIGDAFADLAHDLHNQEGVEETLDLLVAAAPALVGSDSAGVLLTRRGRLCEAGPGSDLSAEKADQLQLEYQAGPAWRAVTEQRTIHVRDVREAQCQAWGEAAEELGIRSALAVRLWTATSTQGAITFYARTPGTFDSNTFAIAEIVGRHASVALASARHEESLNRAIDGRKLVGQAQGILMERFALDDQQAFAVLRRYSQEHNVKLTEVARELVDTRRLPEE
ncbi:GAF and ANTAR domain-containing protein [Nocardioides montaniterrae]